MFEYDKVLGDAIFEYCRQRLIEDPVPLDFGSLLEYDDSRLDGLITRDGVDPVQALEFFRRELAPSVISTDSPAFLAFIPSAPTKNSLLFDMVVACSGLNGTSWLESAGVVRAENQALAFLAERAGMAEAAGGCFTSGGSIGNLSALAVARDVGRLRRPDREGSQLRVAMSADAHSSIGGALHILGLGALIVEPTDHRFTLEALERALEADDDRDSVIAVAATCGTTNVGIIDDLEGLGQWCRDHEIWFHVDGAYGGAAMLAPSRRERTTGLRHADSFIVDPHKWLFAPLDCCALMYREPHIARAVHTQQAGYLDILHGDDSHGVEWNPSDYAIHLSRRARGLPFWFSLVTNGVAAYESAVESAIELAEFAEREVESRESLELVRGAELSIILFRRKGWSPEDYTRWSHDLVRRQIALVTPTKWEGETVARLSFLHPETSRELVLEILDSLEN